MMPTVQPVVVVPFAPFVAAFVFCGVVAGCDTAAEGEGDGEEGEGEGFVPGGPCADDADCGSGLCYDVDEDNFFFEADRANTCLPGADVDLDCPEAEFFGDRSAGGQVVFAARASEANVVDACPPDQMTLTLGVTSFDREGDGADSSVIFVLEPGGSPVAEPAPARSVEGEPLTDLFISFSSGCYSRSSDHVAIAVGGQSPTSNGLCVPIRRLP